MRLYKPNKDKPEFIMTTPKFLKWLLPPAPESNRQQLREALIESASKGKKIIVKFNHSITKINQKNEKQAELFGKKLNEDDDNDNDDKNTKIISLGIFDLVIDASGFGSKLRNYRIEDEDDETRFKKYYTGISMCHGLIYNPDSVCDPKIIKKLGEGSMLCFNNGIGFGLQRYGASEEDKRTSMYYMIPLKEISYLSDKFNIPRKTIFHKDKEIINNVKEWIKNELKIHNFSKDHFSAIDNIDAISIRPLMQHPQNPKFNDNSELPLILIGDSLHAMPPYTGSGGNLALADADELSDYIIKKNLSFSIKDLRILEKKFLKRAIPIMKQGNSTKNYLIDNDRKFRNGENVSDTGLMGAGYLFYIIASIFTYIYYLECFLHLRKDNGRS